MNYWERRVLSERLERQEMTRPFLEEALNEYSKSAQLVKHSQMFEKWTLGEIDFKTASRYFEGRLFKTSDSEIKGRLQEYIEYLKAAAVNEPEENVRNPDDPENHILMQRLKTESPITYKAMQEALADKFITFEQNRFNFHCDKGCVGFFFREGGFTEYKTLNEYVLIKGRTPVKTTLENCTKNTPPKSWERIKEKYFGTPSK